MGWRITPSSATSWLNIKDNIADRKEYEMILRTVRALIL